MSTENGCFVLVPTAEFAELKGLISELLKRQANGANLAPSAATIGRPNTPSGASPSYVEPGPGSPRKWFTAKELESRWGTGFKKSKIYALSALELPYWEHGRSGRRYFWSHVWAFEGRLSSKEGERLFLACEEVHDAI